MKKCAKTAKFWIAVALILCLISCIGASAVQTAGGSIEYHDMTFVTQSGHELDAILLVPENATAENPAPAIVCSHGWYNNREMQDLNYVEYARRGFVVISISMYGHGDSEIIAENTWWDDVNNGNGLYDAVKYLAELPFVDASRIGVTGHSNGARASRESVLQDDEGLIAACLLVSNDPVYKDADGNYYDMFGKRDAGVVACQYDEFFHRVKQDDGTVSPPRDYINQATAQSFLYFGTDPAGQEMRNSYTFYTGEVDGEEVIRVIFNPEITHPWAHFSKDVVSNSVEFFDKALEAPVKLDGNDQIWQWKAFFNAVGLVGFFMFLIYTAIALSETKFFEAAGTKKEVLPAPAPKGQGAAWYWGGLAAGAIFGLVTYAPLYTWCNAHRPAFWNQPATWYIGIWTLCCGLFTILMLVLSYNLYGKKNGADLSANGVKMSMERTWKTILLSVTTVAAAFELVHLADYFFLADFRLWCFATIRDFPAMHIGTIAKYLVFWLVYYIALSVATNGFNYVQIGKKNWISCAIQMFFVFIGPEIFIGLDYITFFKTGHLWTTNAGVGGSIIGIWMYPIVFILPLAAFICRKIYKKTNNPYIGGIIMGLVACTISITNTLTYLL